MIGLLTTALLFPAVGLAVSRLVGRVQPYLAGAGIVGALLFIFGVAHVPFRLALAAIVAGSVAVLAVRRRGPAETPTRYPLVPTALMALVAAWLLVMTAIVPLDDYDGRAFWLLKAKAIAHEQQVDGPFFQQRESFSLRNQYPLLMPIDAAVTMLAGNELDDRQARWLYAFFAIALALEVRRRLAAWFSPELGAWMGAALLCTPQVVSAASGAASAGSDVPLGAFVAAAFFEIVESASPLRLGMWLSFVALTKSEGLPLALLLLVVGAVTFRKRIAVAAAPLAVSVTALLIWRSRVPRSDELPFARLIFDLPRHADRFLHFLGDFGVQPLAMRTWGALWIAFVIAIVVLAARRRWRVVFLASAVIVPMILLYAAVVAVTEWEPAVMAGLAPRLLTHLLGPGLSVIGAALGGGGTPPIRPAGRRRD